MTDSPVILPARHTPLGPIEITDVQLEAALVSGWSVAMVAAQVRCSPVSIYRRIRAARDLHGPFWGGAVAVPTCDDPAAQLRARLDSLPPTTPEVRALATHAVAWALETGTAASASVGKLALSVLESPEFRNAPERAAETDRRRELLEVIVQALAQVPA